MKWAALRLHLSLIRCRVNRLVRYLFSSPFKVAVATVLAVVLVLLSGTLYICKCDGKIVFTPKPQEKAECCTEKCSTDTPDPCQNPCNEPVQMVLATSAEFGWKSQDSVVFVPPSISCFLMEQCSMGVPSKKDGCGMTSHSGRSSPPDSCRLHLRLRVLLV